MKRYFVTGTDTDVGKTVVAKLLIQYFNDQGLSTAAFKPVSAGCEQSDNGLVNEDALALQQLSSIDLAYDVVNPFAYEPPIAPHIAADMVGQRISVNGLSEAFEKVCTVNADVTLIEGAGGWYLPINDSEFLFEWVAKEKLPVILVVGIKLGCLNHALLTQAAIKAQGLTLVGWVANLVAPQTLCIEQNIQSLQQTIDAPLLARVPFVQNPQQMSKIDFLI